MSRLFTCAIAISVISGSALAAEPSPLSAGKWELKQGKDAKIDLVAHDGNQSILTVYRICQDNGPVMKILVSPLIRIAPGQCFDVVTDKPIALERSRDDSVERATGFFHLLFAAKK